MNEGFRSNSSCSRENHQLRGPRRNDDEGRKGKSVVVVVVVMVIIEIEFSLFWRRMRYGSSH